MLIPKKLQNLNGPTDYAGAQDVAMLTHDFI